MQRRVEQADRHRQAVHDLEQSREIGTLHRQDLGQGGAALRFGVGEDHLAHGDDAVIVEEHVFGAAQADALGAEFARDAGVVRRVGVGAHLQAALGIGPAHQHGEFAGQFGLQRRHRAGHHLPGGAVDGDDLALSKVRPMAVRVCFA